MYTDKINVINTIKAQVNYVQLVPIMSNYCSQCVMPFFVVKRAFHRTLQDFVLSRTNVSIVHSRLK